MSNREIGVGIPQACASCKHQRKKCDDTCELAPYFPASKLQEFLNAYRLFGVSNIIKILNSVEPHQRHEAAESLIKEARIRKDYPVHGCLGVVDKLHAQIEIYQRELDLVNQQLVICRKAELLEQQLQLQTLWTNETSLPLPTSVLPTLQQLRHSSSISSQIPSDQYGSSYSSPLSSSVQQIDDPYCQTLVLPDLPREAFYLGDTKDFDHAYNYSSTLEEETDDIVKPYDIDAIDQMLEDGDGFTSFKEPHSSSARSKAYGKQALDFDNSMEIKTRPMRTKASVPKKKGRSKKNISGS